MAGDAAGYYAALGLPPDASGAEVRNAYRRLALSAHPDRGGDPDVFQAITKAYEVLNNGKARARYDRTGRATALTVVEEFREAFFDLGGAAGGGTSSSSGSARPRAGEAVAADQAAAQAREQERQEARRRAEETERRDAARRAQLSGGGGRGGGAEVGAGGGAGGAAPAPAASAGPGGDPGDVAPAPPASTGPRPGTSFAPAGPLPVGSPAGLGEGLCVGAKVQLIGLKTQPQLNGSIGTVVDQQEGRWQVSLGKHGDKLLRGKNLLKVLDVAPPARPPADPRAAAGPAATAQPRPAQAPREPAHPASSSTLQAHEVLPIQRFRVVLQFANVRRDASLSSAAIARKALGEEVRGSEETFDGWVRLADEPGWMIKDMRGTLGVGVVLSPVGDAPLLAIPEVLAAAAAGPQKFEVVFAPRVAVRAGPSKTAPILGARQFGEEIAAESQTYGGWVRVCASEGGGWILSSDACHGMLLRARRTGLAEHDVQAHQQPLSAPAVPKSHKKDTHVLWHRDTPSSDAKRSEGKPETVPQHREKTRRECEAALATLADALATAEVRAISAALVRARGAGVPNEKVEEAEAALAQLRKSEAKRLGFRAQIGEATEAGNEVELRSCADECAEQNFHDEAAFAAQQLERLLVEKRKTRETNVGLLGELAAAARSGDRAKIKAARDAAKKAGVPMQDIARAFALQSGGRQEPEPPPAPKSEPTLAPEPELLAPPSDVTPLEYADNAVGSHENNMPFAGVSGKYSRDEAAPASVGLVEGDQQGPRSAPHAQACGPFDGDWTGLSGEYMATIQGTTIIWADGPAAKLEEVSITSFACRLFDTRFRAQLDLEGHLSWSDGDVWSRGEAGVAGADGVER